MKNSILVAIFITGIIGSAGIVSAFWPTILSKEQKTKIQEAIKNNDFEAWKNIMISSLTQENFNKIVERYKAATEIKELQKMIKQSIKEGNYNSYKEAIKR